MRIESNLKIKRIEFTHEFFFQIKENEIELGF